MDLLSYSAVELAAAIKEGKATAVQAMEAVLARIGETEGTINAYVTIDKEAALAAAQRTQEKIASGAFAGPLAGVPVAVKDNLCTKGILTTCASRMLGNFVPTFSAEAVTKLEHAGAVVIGKTNMDEFAMGSTTETSAYGETKNPWNLAHVPGGSGVERMFFCAWLGYGRLNTAAGVFLRCCGAKADLWNGFKVWVGCVRFFPGSDWTSDEKRIGLRCGVGSDCRAG